MDKIKIHSYVTLMNKIPSMYLYLRALRLCIRTQTFNNIKLLN